MRELRSRFGLKGAFLKKIWQFWFYCKYSSLLKNLNFTHEGWCSRFIWTNKILKFVEWILYKSFKVRREDSLKEGMTASYAGFWSIWKSRIADFFPKITHKNFNWKYYLGRKSSEFVKLNIVLMNQIFFWKNSFNRVLFRRAFQNKTHWPWIPCLEKNLSIWWWGADEVF